MKRRNKIALGILLGLLALTLAAASLAYYYAAYITERKAVSFLTQRGVEVASLKVDRLDISGAELRDVQIRKPLRAGLAKALIGIGDSSFALTGVYIQPTPDQRLTADLTGKYTLDLQGDTLSAEGMAKGISDPFTARFALTQDFSGGSSLTISQAALQWGGGTVGIPTLTLELPPVKPVTFTLQLRSISLDALLKKALGEASAEGTVSGDIPVMLKPDGSFTLGAGTLTASHGGVIRIPAGTFPAQNEQVAMVSGVLSDFHYSTLAIMLVPGEAEKLNVRLQLEGRNPNAYGGREVKLNINLGGDVLHFVQFSLLPLNDPSRWLNEQKP